jgi:putative tryptophan/tyrosine transport system substrate-binding protein
MRRRDVIKLLGGAAAAWPHAAHAQQPEKNVRVGVLGTLPLPPVQRFFRKLQEYGYIEWRNLRLEARAEGWDDRYPALAAELVANPGRGYRVDITEDQLRGVRGRTSPYRCLVRTR